MSGTGTDSVLGRDRRRDPDVGVWEKNSDFGEFHSSAYYPNTEESGGKVAPIKFQPGTRDHVKSGRTTRDVSQLAQRDAIRRAVDRATEHASRMVMAAESGDAIELSNSGFTLVNILNDLWNLREVREPNWRDLVNLLQGALAKENFESFTVCQCTAIKEIISEYLKVWTVDDEDLRSSISVLRRAELDPWKGISGDMEKR